MLVVLFKTVSIQMDNTPEVFMTSNDGNEKIPTRIAKLIPRRGQILDMNYTPLVTSVSFYDIHMDPVVVKDKLFTEEISNLCEALADLYPSKTAHEYETYIRQARKDSARYLLIKNMVSSEERRIIREMPIFNKGRLTGGLIDNEDTIIRKRPFGELLKRTLGYVKIIDGDLKKVGIEGAFDEYLRGIEGEEIEQLISNSWKKIGSITKEAVEGANIVSTIDIEIQEVAHAELLRQLQAQDAKNGCVVVMDVKTGYIRAIVNLRRDANGNYNEGYNQAIGIKEVPGSTFKLASLMAALEDGRVTINDMVDAKGVYKFYNHQLTDSNHGYGYGMISIQTAFEKSSNVFSQIINDAYKNDPEAFIKRLKSFGLADTLDIGLRGEPMPTLYEPGSDNWSGISLPWMAIGYEVQQTPLQTLTFYNAVANNGVLVKPQFVQEIRRGNDVIKTFPPVILNDQICSESTLRDVQACLEGVVKRGTGSALQSAYFDIAGKTGTALVLNDDLRYGENGEKKYQASFAGYFPADDPLYSCIVIISAPNKDVYGAKVSGTVFTAIANKVYASSLQYHTPVNDGELADGDVPISMDGNRYDLLNSYRALKIPFNSTTDGEWVNTSAAGNQVEVKKRAIIKGQVPDVRGMTARDAVYLIEQSGMTARLKGYGKVVKQSITPGSPVVNRVIVELTLE